MAYYHHTFLCGMFFLRMEDIFHGDFKICCKAKSCFKAGRILTHNPAKSFKCFSFGNLNRIVLIIQ